MATRHTVRLAEEKARMAPRRPLRAWSLSQRRRAPKSPAQRKQRAVLTGLAVSHAGHFGEILGSQKLNVSRIRVDRSI